MADTIHLEEKNGIAIVCFNRPKAYNAFDLPTVEEFAKSMTALALDRNVAGVIISGKGKAFCAGGDLKWVADQGEDFSKAFHLLAAQFHQGILEIRRMPKPVIAAVNGPAAGGGFSLTLACDFRVMAANAVLKQGYTSSGLSIDGGGSFMLPRLVGAAKALEIAAFDRPINAEDAQELGLVIEIVEEGQAIERSYDLMCRLKDRSLDSFAASKKLITDAFNTGFETHLENERHLLSFVAGRSNGVEGMKAFLEKRPPVFNATGGE